MPIRLSSALTRSIVLLLMACPVAGHAAPACDQVVETRAVGTSEATADILANAFSRSGSLNEESKALLSKARDESLSAKPPASECAAGCALQDTPRVILTSIPRKFRQDHPNRALCSKKLEETTAEPLVVSNRRFSTLEDLSQWIEDFSRGKGDDGEQLYERCDGGCSPHYTFRITPREDEVLADAVVRCGLPRDRSDNHYILSARYEWRCHDAGHAAAGAQ